MNATRACVITWLSASVALASSSAQADPGYASDALPGIVNVPIASPETRGLALATFAGYGFTEGVLHIGDSYSRVSGSLAASYQPTSYFTAGLNFIGRYETDSGPEHASGSIGDPKLELRFAAPLSPSFALGAQLGLWAPGSTAPSLVGSALTPDASILATLAPRDSRLTFSSRLGFRLDNSIHSVRDPAHLALADRVELGISDANAVLAGVGVAYRATSNVDVLADATWNILVGSDAPSATDSPILLSAGARFNLDDDRKLQLQAMVTVSPSGRPEVTPTSPFVDIEPRVSAFVGLTFRPYAHREVVAEVKPTPAPVAPAPVAVVVAPKRAKLVGHAITEDGKSALPHAHVVLLLANGAQRETDTDDQGAFTIDDLDPGKANVTITAEGFAPLTRALEIGADEPVELSVAKALPAGEVRGVVRDFAGKPIAASIRIEPIGVDVTVAKDGTFHTDVAPGKYDVVIKAPGYSDQKRKITIERDGVTVINVELRKK